MALCTFQDIPNTIVVDIFAHFNFNANWFYRRVSAKWRHLLTYVFGICPLAVDIGTLQHKVLTDENCFTVLESLRASVEDWFASQKGTQRNIFFYGHGEPLLTESMTIELAETIMQYVDKKDPLYIPECLPRWWMWANLRLTAEDLLEMRLYEGRSTNTFFVPPTCHLLLKDCYVGGFNWVHRDCARYRSSLFTIPVTEFEVVDFGNDGELEDEIAEGYMDRFAAEMLRLGRKYAKAMNAVERRILDHHLRYFCLESNHDHQLETNPELEQNVNEILRWNEPSPENQVDLPGTLQRMVDQWKDIKLNPLTERLLEALCSSFVG